jgi:hypothetical protein
MFQLKKFRLYNLLSDRLMLIRTLLCCYFNFLSVYLIELLISYVNKKGKFDTRKVDIPGYLLCAF